MADWETITPQRRSSDGWETVSTNEKSIPGQGVVPPVASAPTSMLDRIRGAGEAALSVGTALPASVIGAWGGLLSQATGGEKADQFLKGFVERNTYQPRTATGREYLQGAGDALSASKIAGIGPTEGMALAGAAGPAMTQAARAGGRAVAPVVSAIAESPEAELLKRGASRALSAVTPNIQPEVGRLAMKAQSLGIPLRPDMLTDNKFARMMGEALEKVPLSGSKDEMRQTAFNRALGQTIGAERNANKVTPDVFDRAMTQSGEKIGEISGRTNIPMSSDFGTLLTNTQLQAQRFETADVAKIVTNYIQELRDKAGPTGVIPGEAFRKLNSEIGRRARSADSGDLKRALGDLQDDMHDALVANAAPGDIPVLQEARKQYAIGKTLEPLIAKSPTGDISPAALMAAVTATKDRKSMMARGRGGDLGDIARIGQLFLKEPSSSGTAERTLSYGLMTGAGAINLPAATAIYGGANAYNRIGPSVTRGILANLQREQP